MKSLLILMMEAMMYVGAGCTTWDTIVGGTSSDTNAPVVNPPVVTNAPVVACGCNLSGPLVDPPPPYTGEWLKKRNELAKKTKNQGNSEECPVYDGYDVRYAVIHGPNKDQTWLIASPFKGQMTYGTSTMTLKCVSKNGCRWHVKAWAIGRPEVGSSNWKEGNTATLRRTGVFFLVEVRDE